MAGDASRRVVEVIRGAAKGVDLQFVERSGGKIGIQGVEGGGNDDSALGVRNQDDFIDRWGEQSLFEGVVADSDIRRHVRKVALDEAFDQVKDEAIRAIVDASNGPLEDARDHVEVLCYNQYPSSSQVCGKNTYPEATDSRRQFR